mmetsp:Transcript_8564/g.13126  ORF Transcript_8564/g.13126 Transcript_8564/m.13126 type:complete len:294 (+) Transcript_8564:301-1182(+)
MDQILDEVVQILDHTEPTIDLILLTGDYVNHNPQPIERFCQTFVKRIQGMASLGIFASLGNHDNYGNDTDVPSPSTNSMEYITQCLTDTGVTVLRNELQEVKDGIWVCGLEDVWNPTGWRHHKGVMKELHLKNDAILRLVLSHNPDTAEQLKDYHHDVQLAGHTHGGQICLPSIVKISGYTYNVPVLALLRPIFDWVIIQFPRVATNLKNMRRQRKYSYIVNNWQWSQGLHDVTDETRSTSGSYRKQLYVSRGIGTHRNMRLFCPPELAILTISCKHEGNCSRVQNTLNKKEK